MLYVDGKEIETRIVNKVAVFTIPLTGQHRIKAVSGSFEDEITLEKVDAPWDEYLFQKEEIINWFDREELDPACFSVEDTMGAISGHPEAGKVLAEVMEVVHASRGEVAQASGKNTNLIRMLSGMKLRDVFKKAGNSIPKEMIQETNKKLQKIKKMDY